MVMSEIIEEPVYVVQITDSSIEPKYFQKYITLKKVKVTEQLALAKTGKRGSMIRAAILMRMNGIQAHAMPLEVSS